MIKWRAFDHVSFAIGCSLAVLTLIARRPMIDAVILFVTGVGWTIYHSYSSSKEPGYRVSSAAKIIAAALYTFTLFGGFYLAFVRTD